VTDDNTLAELSAKLDAIGRLLAVQICMQMKAEGKNQADQIQALDAAGLDRPAIASAVGTTTDTVRATLSKVRRKDAAQGQKPSEGGLSNADR